LDAELSIITFNTQCAKQYLAFFGKEIIKGASILNYAQKEKKEALKLIYKKVLEGGSHESELEIASADKLSRTLLLRYKPAYDEKRRIIGVCISSTDISEIKKSQQLLTTNEKRFRALVENGGDAIAILGADGKPTYVSPSITKVLGYTEEEALNLNMFAVVHPEDVGPVTRVLESCFANPGVSIKGHTGRMRHKNGTWRWYEAVVTNMLHDPLINGIVNNFRDVTEKTLAEQEKEFDHSNLQALINNTNDMMWSISKEGKMITSNSAFDAMVKYMSGGTVIKGGDTPAAGFSEEQLKKWDQLYTRAFSGETFTIVEYTDFPVEYWSEISFYPFRNGDEIIGVACYSRNITERKLFERKLEKNTTELIEFKNELAQSEASLKEAQEMAQLASWEADFQTYQTTWSDQFYKILGVEKNEITPSFEGYLTFVHPEDLSRVKETIETGNKSLKEYFFNYRIITKDGDIKHIHSSNRFVNDKAGNPQRLQGIMQDVTERKKSEEKLLHSESRLRQAQEVAHVGNWEINFATNTSIWSDEAYRIYGIEPGEHGMSYEQWREFIHPEDLEGFLCEMKKSTDTLQDFSHLHRLIRTDGIVRHVISQSRFEFDQLGKPMGLYGTVHDITERIKAEESLMQSHKLLQKLTDKVPVAVYQFQIDKEGNMSFPFMSSGINEILQNIDTENLKSDIRTLFTKVHPDDTAGFLSSIEISRVQLSNWDLEFRAYNEHNQMIWLRGSSRPEKGENGTIVWYGYLQDITERKHSEELIKQSKERYDFVAKATNDAIYDWDLETNKVLRTGDGLSVLFGFNDVETTDDSDFWKKRIHADDVNDCYRKLDHYLEDPSKKLCDMEYRFRKADDSYAYVYDKGYIVRNAEGKPVRLIGATRDITHRKETEILLKELNESLEKRAGELARSNSELEQFAYIASHDLQEPLRMVTSFLTQLENKYKDQLDDKAKKYIYFATDGASRMRRIILDLLEYSRVGRQSHEREQIDLNEIVAEVGQLNRTEIDEKNALITCKDMPVFKGSRPCLQRVFQNLVGNALKYQKRGQQPVIEIKAKETETHWEFAVSDNGIGIESQYFEKIFIVFQRLHNKDDYSGTGIGLAICKKIVENHNGRIWLESEYGSGTTFYFTISKNL